ncbi:MAG: hypothetical protein JSV49_02610 [Thermoplasmata archaeon]|nr:MAG: hypothetical protein JSV49_02610 [Thermoplasmata archaeon]
MRFQLLGKIAIIVITVFMISSTIPAIIPAEDAAGERTDASESDDITHYEDTMFVEGHVIDKATGMMIGSAYLHFYNEASKFRCVTNNDGFFIIELPPGAYEVLVTAEGYMDLFEKVAGRTDQVIEVKYFLGPRDDTERPKDEPSREEEPKRPPPPEDERERIRIEENERSRTIRDALGGGDCVIIRNDNSDSFLAIVYGTREQPNDITILAYYTHYIGAGDIYDENGALIGRNEPIAVKIIYKQTFSLLKEYSDNNQDGLFNIKEYFDGYNHYIRHEPVYKAVSLKTAWHRSEIIEETYKDTVKEYTFELTAKNLPYRIMGDPEKIVARGNLDLVKFTFHIYLKKDDVTRDDVPIYDVDVETSSEGDIETVTDAELKEYRSYKGSRISTKVKYDYLISGWDYDPSNSNPMLFLDMDIALLRAGEGKIARWLGDRELENMFMYKERFQYQNEEGIEKELYVKHDETRDEYELVEKDEPDYESTGTRGVEEEPVKEPPEENEDEVPLKEYDMPEKIDDNQLRFKDNLNKLGSFSWVSNVTADGEDVLINFQINKIIWLKKYIEDKVFMGILVKGGFNLPGAQEIYHDPTFASEMYTLDITSEPVEVSGPFNGRVIITAIIILIVIAIILIAFYGTITSDKERKMVPPRLPNESKIRSEIDRDKNGRKKEETDEYYESFYIDWED